MDERTSKIISIIKLKGPVVPSQISGEIGYNQLMTSAMLSDLVSSKTLMISYLKVGSSPLYYFPEQKSMLENFIDKLPGKEKEAFLMIKRAVLVEDTKLEPVFKVAIRNLKDFAIPIQIVDKGIDRIFWHFYTLPRDDAVKRIEDILKNEAPAKEEKKEVKELVKEEKIEPIKKIVRKRKVSKPAIKISTEEKSKLKEQILNFAKTIELEVAEEKKSVKDEFHMLASVNSTLGKLPYLLIFKNKEIVNIKDLKDACKKGAKEKMPVLFITKGKLDENAEKSLSSFKGHLIFRKI